MCENCEQERLTPEEQRFQDISQLIYDIDQVLPEETRQEFWELQRRDYTEYETRLKRVPDGVIADTYTDDNGNHHRQYVAVKTTEGMMWRNPRHAHGGYFFSMKNDNLRSFCKPDKNGTCDCYPHYTPNHEGTLRQQRNTFPDFEFNPDLKF